MMIQCSNLVGPVVDRVGIVDLLAKTMNYFARRPVDLAAAR